MATSGTNSWTLQRDAVINGALRKLAVLPSGATGDTNQIADGSTALNAICKALQAEGMPLWKIVTATFTTTAGTSSYTIGPSQTINSGKPNKVLEAFYTVAGGNNTPLNVYNRYDFMLLPASTTVTGTPVNIYYQPLRTTGTLALWPTPVDSTTSITIHYQAPFDDVNSATDDLDFPSYWMQALIYLLAWTLAPEYGIPTQDRQQLAVEAKYWKDEALSNGSEEGSIYLQPRDD